MPIDTTEKKLEELIEVHLKNHGYLARKTDDFNRANALDSGLFFQFLEKTQPTQIKKLYERGGDIKERIVEIFQKNVETRGIIDVFRNGFEYYGTKLDLAYFKPANTLNPDTVELYNQNILSYIRQLHYSKRDGLKSVDIGLFLNGIPIATVELKSSFSGQYVEDAVEQYRTDRDINEPLFKYKNRAIVHFAVDNDEVRMCTKLMGNKSFFLPFNKGDKNGAGNPENPEGYKTAYLWDDIWKRDSWLEILGKFIQLHVEEKRINGEKIKTEKLIFPRYHQLDAVRTMIADVKEKGPGHQYLIQHSTGSGKSNTIAWLAHQLSNLHDDNNRLIFDSTVVITDRRVLDAQLQDTIYQIDHKRGVVTRIKGETVSKSREVASALGRGDKIIITTLQTFPYVLEVIREKKGSIDFTSKNFAVIVDEAHSSQSGRSAAKVKHVLTYENEDIQDAEDVINELMKSQGKLPNLSFFAFTATPKNRTLEQFGVRNEDGEYFPFHLYSMRQAIEEEFILDVLRNYTTYTEYLQLIKKILDDPEYNKKRAQKAIKQFIDLSPDVLKQKATIMLDHFMSDTIKKIDGKAKAMVVTSSRLHALRYKFIMDHYIKEKKYPIRTLVAFSGALKDEKQYPGKEFTEAKINGFGESELPEKFSTPEYQILIVAEKYQTGFDEPLLHTMYVEKELRGVSSVQTLSRLNRIYPGKEDTFVMDFVNSAKDIQKDFQKFYETAFIEHGTDPYRLEQLLLDLDKYGVYSEAEVESFADIFYKPSSNQIETDLPMLNAIIDPAVSNFKRLSDEEKEEFKAIIKTYLNLYSFLTHIVNLGSKKLEIHFSYLKFLGRKLPRRGKYILPNLGDDLAFEYYKLRKAFEGTIDLKKGELIPQSPISTKPFVPKDDNEKTTLSELIRKINEMYGTEFTEQDALWLKQIQENLVNDPSLQQQAAVNPYDNFREGFRPRFDDALLESIDDNVELVNTILNNEQLRSDIIEFFGKKMYEQLRRLSYSQ
jgi:type I restriction enzyme R subunit